MRRWLQRHGGDDRGSVSLELVVVFPIVLLILFGVVQGSLYYHARSVALAAAQEGLRETRIENGTADAGQQRAEAFVDAAGGDDVLRDVSIAVTRDATQAKVTVAGTSLSVVPGWAGMSVTQTAAGPVERVTAS